MSTHDCHYYHIVPNISSSFDYSIKIFLQILFSSFKFHFLFYFEKKLIFYLKIIIESIGSSADQFHSLIHSSGSNQTKQINLNQMYSFLSVNVTCMMLRVLRVFRLNDYSTGKANDIQSSEKSNVSL
jgi:hypothetical protein